MSARAINVFPTERDRASSDGVSLEDSFKLNKVKLVRKQIGRHSKTSNLCHLLITSLVLCILALSIGVSVCFLWSVIVPKSTGDYLPTSFQPLTENGNQSSMRLNETVLSNDAFGRNHENGPSLYTILLLTVVVLIAILLLIYLVVLPLVFRFWTSVHYRLLFGNEPEEEVEGSDSIDNHCIHKFRLSSSQNFDASGSRIQLGVWHLPPNYDEQQLQWYLHGRQPCYSFVDTRCKVFLFAHGSGGSRGSDELDCSYKRLCNQLNAHVVAFDYRGFGDSFQARPSADGITQDTKLVYKWILNQGVTPDRIVLWGHSLGSAVVIRLLTTLARREYPLTAILEAPFTTIAEGILNHPTSKWVRRHPLFQQCFVSPFTSNPDLNFDSLSLLPRIQCPLLILHSEDDSMIPCKMGEKLCETARKVQPEAVRHKTKMIKFPSELKLDHFDIFELAQLTDIVQEFFVFLQTDDSNSQHSVTLQNNNERSESTH